MNKKTNIIILGGGLSGLAAALRLKEKDKDLNIKVLEKKSYFGGLAASFNKGAYEIPIYYHHIINSNKTTKKYLQRYDLLKSCKWKRIKIGISNKRKLFNIQSLKGLLGYNGLSLWGKFRFGLFGLYIIFFMNPKKIPKNVDAYSWLIHYAGKETTHNVFHHLYARNKFNVPLTEISASQFAYRLKEKEVFDKFSYPKLGLHKMIAGIVKELISFRVGLFNNITIKEIDLKKKQLKYVINGRTKIEKYDKLINTIPIPEFLKVAKGLPLDYKKNLFKLKYCPAVNIAFATDKFMDKEHYWINLFSENAHIIMQHSILNNNYPWKVNWILRYGGSEEDLDLPDSVIEKKYLAVIKSQFPHVKILWTKVFREKYAEPIYDKDYSEYMPHIRTPVKDLFMTGIQTTYPKIRNMTVALESGENVAEVVFRDKSIQS